MAARRQRSGAEAAERRGGSGAARRQRSGAEAVWGLGGVGPRRRCGGTGLFGLDVEAIPLGPASDLAGCEAVLETAAVLGARYLNVICDDPDTGRFADRLAELVRLARPYRVRPVIEFTAWRPI